MMQGVYKMMDIFYFIFLFFCFFGFAMKSWLLIDREDCLMSVSR